MSSLTPASNKFRTVVLRSARLLSDEINKILEQHQLNYSLWQVMYISNETQGITSNEIAQYLKISKPSITKRVHALVALNILELSESDDKREKKLHLSTEGIKTFNQCSQAIDQYEKLLLSTFDAEGLTQTTQMLSSILHKLEQSKSGACA